MMNFDEFRASSERDRLRKEEQRHNAIKPTVRRASFEDTTEKKLLEQIGGDSDKPAGSKPIQDAKFGFDDFLETYQMQSFVVMILMLDTFASFIEIYIAKERLSRRRSPSSTMNDILLVGLHSFTSFTIFFFAIEIVAVLVVFRSSVIGHLGYGMDLLIVVLQLYLELFQGAGRETRILNIFRVWRSIRLFNSIVNIEKSLHEKTIERLNLKDTESRKLRIDIQRLEIDLGKEKEAKDAVEDMLLTYKEEVDTLNEALKIAAMDIAEVAEAEDDFSSDDDEESDEKEVEEDDEDFVDAPSSDYDKNKNRAIIMRFARKDGSESENSSSNARSTFVIQGDGSFEMT